MLPELSSFDFQPKFYTGTPSRFHLPFLYDLVAAYRPQNIVVLGFAGTQVHFTFLQAAREQEVASHCLTIRRATPDECAIDDVAWQKAIAHTEEFFAGAGALREGDPVKVATEDTPDKIDLLLIDDCDSADVLRAELRAWEPKLAPNAIVLAHGILIEREHSPREAWAEFCADRPAFVFEQGIGLSVTKFNSEPPAENSLLALLFGCGAGREELILLYQAIAARIDAQHRASEAERQKSALQLRQAWLDTMLHDRWKAQEVMDHLGREVSHLREVVEANKEEPQARAFANLLQDRAKAQLIMDAQAEQLKQWVGRSEALSAENKTLKARGAEQKKILNAAKKACRKGGKCFHISDGKKKERRSLPDRIMRELRRIPTNLSRISSLRQPSPDEPPPEVAVVVDRYAEWISQHEPDAAGLEAQRAAAASLSHQPKISLLLPVLNTPVAFLEDLLASLAAQTYGNFEICAVDGGSSDAKTIECLKQSQEKEPRLKLEFLPENLGVAENTNRALALATGDFMACIDHDDRLPPFALYELARAISDHPEGDMFYSDEDRLSEEGKRHAPFFKPEWSPEYLLSSMYLGHLTAYRRDLAERVGGFRKEFDLSQDYDFALRATEEAKAILHIPHVLYHWREHAASGSAGGKPEARQTNLAALADAMRRRGLAADVLEYPAANRVRMKITQWPKVSIIIPTDSPERGKFLVEELPRMTSYPDYEVVIVTNSGLAEQLALIAPPKPLFRFVRYDHVFNFSEKCNLGAHAASGDRLIFFNDDVESGQPDWIQNLIEPLENPAIGGVAPKLLYETGKIQHAGLVTGVRGLVGTACHQWPADSTDYTNFAQSMRNVSALSGACLAMRRDDFFAVGEWDAVNVPIAHSDLDLSFKIRAAGLRCVYTPFVTMRHRGHASLGPAGRAVETSLPQKVSVFLLNRWPEYSTHDPYFPDNMRDWIYADSPTPVRMWARSGGRAVASKADLLFVTHDLTWSGAPLLLFHLAQWCKEQGYFVAVMSPGEGPLARKFIVEGIPLIVDPLITQNHPSFAQFAREFDCVIANTIFSAPIVRSAKAAGVPHIWWIHEGRVAKHYLGSDANMRSALGLADLIVTPDTHSSQVYQPFTNRAVRVLQDGIPDPNSALPPRVASSRDRITFLLLGTIEQRKGQQVFLNALQKLPEGVSNKALFRIVGRPHDLALAAEIRAAVKASTFLSYDESVPHEEALALIRDADVMVSTSWDETGPLILMEALALGTPILSTTVGAVAENLVNEEAGLFFPAGNVSALAEAIERLVREPDLIERLRSKSRAAYEKHFTLDRFTKGFIELLNEVSKKSPAAPLPIEARQNATV